MHQNHWRLGNSPRPHWGNLQVTALPYLLAGLRDLLLRKGKNRGGKGREEDEKRMEGWDGRGSRDFGPSQCWKQIDATGGNSAF